MREVDSDYEESIAHHFAEGTYCREMFMNRDDVVVGKKHLNSCTNVLLMGRVAVSDGDVVRIHQAPFVFQSPAGTKRAIYAITNVRWLTVHGNEDNGESMDIIESRLIAAGG